MLAAHTPAPLREMERSAQLDSLYSQWFLEVGRWSAHLPDSVIIDEIQNNRNLLLYAVNFNGVPIITHGGSKSFFANIRPHDKFVKRTRKPSSNIRQ